MLKIFIILSCVVNSLYIPSNKYKYIAPKKKIYITELNSIFNKNNYTSEHPLNLNYQVMNNKKVNKETNHKEICLKVKKLVFLFFIIIFCYFLQLTTYICNSLNVFINSTNNF